MTVLTPKSGAGFSYLTQHDLKDYSHHLTKYEGKGTSKIPFFKLFSQLGKN